MQVNSTMDDSRAVALRGREVKAGLAGGREEISQVHFKKLDVHVSLLICYMCKCLKPIEKGLKY